MPEDTRKRLEMRLSDLTDEQLDKLQKKWQLPTRSATVARAIDEMWKAEQKRKGSKS